MSYYYDYGAVVTGEDTHNFLALSSDLSIEEFSGFYITDYCYMPVQKYQVLYYDFNWQGWAPARARTLDTMPAKGIALESTLATYYIKILLYGGFYNPDWNFDITLDNKQLWLSEWTAGSFTQNPVNSINQYRQPIATIMGKKQAFFHFQQLWFRSIM